MPLNDLRFFFYQDSISCSRNRHIPINLSCWNGLEKQQHFFAPNFMAVAMSSTLANVLSQTPVASGYGHCLFHRPVCSRTQVEVYPLTVLSRDRLQSLEMSVETGSCSGGKMRVEFGFLYYCRGYVVNVNRHRLPYCVCLK